LNFFVQLPFNIQMAYTIGNEVRFEQYVVSRVWNITALNDLVTAMGAVNFFYQDSRNEGLRALGTFSTAARIGGDLVNADTQFPAMPLYFSCSNDFPAVLSGLESAMSWRDTNVAKDTEVHKTIRNGQKDSESGSADQPGFLGQSAQDAQKRF